MDKPRKPPPVGMRTINLVMDIPHEWEALTIEALVVVWMRLSVSQRETALDYMHRCLKDPKKMDAAIKRVKRPTGNEIN